MAIRDATQLAGRASGDLRRHNRAVVLELVRKHGPISRAELARAGRLSIPAVMDIVGALVAEGLVTETGIGPSSGGRRPVLLELVAQAHCAIGLEVGAQTITAVVTDLHAAVKGRLEVASEMARGPEALMAQLKAVLDDVLAQHTRPFGGILGIGLALPAPVLTSSARTFSPPSYPGWGQLQISELVAAEFRVPVLIDNDAKAAALGELLFGAGRSARNMFYVIADRGIGGAAIVNGDLYRGWDGGAGELGHMLIDLDGPQCGCGRFGCLEAFVGRDAITRRAARALKLGGRTELAGQHLDTLMAEDVIVAGLAGDALARAVLDETGRFLGIGISNMINLLNPELVVLGGDTMRAGDLILDPVRDVVQQRALPGLAEQVQIVTGQLGQDASAIGAAALVLRELFVQGNRLS